MRKPAKNLSKDKRNKSESLSCAVKASWKDPVIRQRRIDGLQRVARDPERCRKIKEHNAKYWLGTKGARFGQIHRDDVKMRIAESLSNWRKRLENDPVALEHWKDKQRLSHLGFRHSLATRRKHSRNMRIRYGTTGKRVPGRESLRYKRWRERVVNRDGEICCICKATGKEARLEIDHVKPWSLFPKLRYDIKNGRVLCRKCHIKYGWKGNRLES